MAEAAAGEWDMEATGDMEGTAVDPYSGSAFLPYDGTALPSELKVHGGCAYDGQVPAGFEGLDSHVVGAAPRARLTDEERLEREVARRRQLELERRARIFDAKRRTIGVDKEFLDQQVAEKQQRRRQQAEMQKVEDRQFMGVNRALQVNEIERNRMRRACEKEAKEFSLENLHFASRREFDINDPKAVTKSAATRIGDEDPRCGPSTMQQFNGEDLLKEERTRQQHLAMVHTLEQQRFEKEMLKRMSDNGDAEYMQAVREITDLRNDMEANEHALRKDIMSQYKDDLMERMRANEEKKRLEAEGNQELNAREIEFQLNGELLNENRSRFRPDGQISKDSYKGSTREEKVQVFAMQVAQANENAERRALEGMVKMDHHNNVDLTRRQLVMMEREKQRMRRSMAMDVAMHNKGLVPLQKETNKDLYKNQISPEFFEQFGVGHR